MPIPATAHFIWYGSAFPWVNLLALRSAALNGGFECIVLHHDDALDAASLACHPWMAPVELRRIQPQTHLAPLGELAEPLAALHERLRSPAARANLIRMAVLATEGGVYLDTDTITLRPLTPLLSCGAFFGEEHITLPARVRQGRALLPWARALALGGVRRALAEIPRGYRAFQRLAPLYHRAANNAVVGADPHHPLPRALLEAMVAMPRPQQEIRYALGTHLLQRLAGEGDVEGLVRHPPEVFYPLGPVISHHWFHIRPSARLEDVLSEDTRIVHWYASVTNKASTDQMSPDYIRAHQDRQLFSRLAVRML